MSRTTDLIPREILFGNPERAAAKISPDGKHLTWLAPDERNVLQVWLAGADGANPRKLTDDPKRGIRSYHWAYDGRTLIYEQDADGDENFHLYAVDVIDGGDARDLTPHEGVRASLAAAEPELPGTILVSMNLRDRQVFDVHRVDLASGRSELRVENPGNVAGWVADADLNVRAATAMADDGGFDLLVRASADDDFAALRHWGPDEQGHPVMFSADGATLYIQANHDANAARLLALDMASGAETVIAEDPQYDVGGLCVHPTARTIQAVAFNREKLTWRILDDSVAGDFEALAALGDGEVHIAGRTLVDDVWIVARSVDDGPVHYYRYDRSSRKATPLFTSQPKLEGLPLAKMEPVSFTARDGLTIHAYLTRPIGLEPGGPAVLLVHGGPWGRDSWGFSPMAQWLANRGYVVLQVNYRGSAGYGKDFLNAGNREWAGKMHDDLIDAAEWLKAEDLADPDGIAIMGGSYGGYATLVGLTFTPEAFACGVDIVGPSSLMTLLKSVPPYWKPMMAIFKHRVGDFESEPEFLDSRSPLSKVDAICRPLLIGQGANDPRVKQPESDQIVAAMREKDLPVEYVVYTDEGHGFARPENRMHFYARAEAFLAKHLGGRAEPIDDPEGHCGEER